MLKFFSRFFRAKVGVKEMAPSFSFIPIRVFREEWLAVAVPDICISDMMRVKREFFDGIACSAVLDLPFMRAHGAGSWLIRKRSVGNPSGVPFREGVAPGNTWKNQSTLLGGFEVAPPAYAVVYAIIACHMQTGEWLFSNEFVRCADAYMDGRDAVHACVGMASSSGMFITSLPDRVSDGRYNTAVAHRLKFF